MFRYFPSNYVWNLSVDLAIEMGARIGEIEEMCAPLQEAASAPDGSGTTAFRDTWSKMADKLCSLAEEDEARGRLLSAGEKYKRAAAYLITCERLQGHGAPGRAELYRRELDVFAHGIALATVILPSLSEKHAAASREEFSHLLDWGLRWALIVMTVLFAASLVLSGLMYQRYSSVESTIKEAQTRATSVATT